MGGMWWGGNDGVRHGSVQSDSHTSNYSSDDIYIEFIQKVLSADLYS